MSPKQTIYEIAEKAKVSIATVSRAMNPETRGAVAEKTLAKVDAVIEKYGYAPNQAAKGLTHRVFNTLGVVVPHGKGLFQNDFYAQTLGGIADSMLESNFRFKMLMLKCGDPRWDSYDFHSAEGVDGLIITHWRAFFSDKKALEQLSLPYVILGDAEKSIHAHFVSSDQRLGGELAAEHLLRQGHRKIVMVEGSPCSLDNKLRVQGFKDYLEERSLEVSKANTLCGHFQEEKAYEEMKQFLEAGNEDFTAVFCLNDEMAFGVIRALKENGMKCPKDVSVVGFDDHARAESFDVPLTTISTPLYDIAKHGTHDLMRYLKSKDKDLEDFSKQRVLLPVELIQRKSVARIGE